ncbi:hypothetical protein BJP39_01070 [Streptomyces sp. CC77]|nr:hypothetical protein BJP39_01070 [Streptomyces sp. CC77]
MFGDSLRLLPWTTEGGSPCYVSADEHGGTVSTFADHVEELILDAVEEAIPAAHAVLDRPTARPAELRVALNKMTRLLSDVHRVAQSRGERLERLRPLQDGGDGVSAALDG